MLFHVRENSLAANSNSACYQIFRNSAMIAHINGYQNSPVFESVNWTNMSQVTELIPVYILILQDNCFGRIMYTGQVNVHLTIVSRKNSISVSALVIHNLHCFYCPCGLFLQNWIIGSKLMLLRLCCRHPLQ